MSFSTRVFAALIVIILVLSLAPGRPSCGEARLLRYPSIMGDRVAFVYAGDIWTVPADGGTARRITSFPEGLEIFPKISPDGEWIAFSGEYDGTRQVYVVSYEGGEPRRLTFYPDVGVMPPRGGYDYMVMDWTPDGKKILVRSNRTPYGRRVGRYFLIDPVTEGLEETLQIPEGGPASFSPDGKRLAYNIKSREFRTWKRYRAGRAQDVFIYDLEKDEVTRITDFEGTDNFPMWVGDSIYFTSDRERTLNIFKHDLSTGELTKITRFDEYDCLWPSRGGTRIVFENGGYLYYHDTSTGETKKIEVSLESDKPFSRPYYKNVKGNIESFSISPSGARAVFAARGEIFTVPAEHGSPRNISRTDGVREMYVEWSPDGKYISYCSEKSGDYEITIRPQDGSGDERQLTADSGEWILQPVWSPDSKKMAFSDKMNRLWALDVESGQKSLVDRSSYAGIGSYEFSPDSKWICYTKESKNLKTVICAYSLDDKKVLHLTDGGADDREPTFSKDGKYLFFVSSRDFDYKYREFRSRLYVATLSKETPSPLAPLSDEEKPEPEEKPKEEKKKEDDKSVVEIERIDAEGFPGRVVALPEEQGRYYGLTAVEGGFVYLTGDKELKRYDLEKRKSEKILENVNNYQVAAKGKKFIYKKGSDYGIASLEPGQKAGAGKLDLGRMELRIDPQAEWRQIYFDAWRIMRDWFYDPDMHKVDWERMRERYAVLLPHLAHRTDLDYIVGELIGELNAGHTYVFSGETPRSERVPVGVLGCELTADGKYYRIDKIYLGENWHENQRSPLTEPGLNVEEGTYIIAVDGREVTTEKNFYRSLENKADVQVTLTINDKPSKKGSRDIVVKPIDSELNLRYMDWVESRSRYVEKLSGGRIGYIHVPNTHYDGFRAFFRAFQPLSDKEALIIDDRYNGGGHSPYQMVQILGNRIVSYWAVRHAELRRTPFPVNEGPKVMLINGLSSSGGDAFPYYFKKMGVGPLIGETTWGGLIGYGYSPRFVDGGGMAVPGYAFMNTEGEWDVEAVGVVPDIYVFDDPALIQAGKDPMIEKAVEYLLEELKKNPVKKITTPEGPDRS